jgi:hypothetical protein
MPLNNPVNGVRLPWAEFWFPSHRRVYSAPLLPLSLSLTPGLTVTFKVRDSCVWCDLMITLMVFVNASLWLQWHSRFFFYSTAFVWFVERSVARALRSWLVTLWCPVFFRRILWSSSRFLWSYRSRVLTKQSYEVSWSWRALMPRQLFWERPGDARAHVCVTGNRFRST